MAELHADLIQAVKETLSSAEDQTAEFKRRLRTLIQNAINSNLTDDDVRDVIELATINESLED